MGLPKLRPWLVFGWCASFLRRLRGFDIFLSYASEDKQWADFVEQLLRRGFRIYRDQTHLNTGQHLDDLLQAVRRSTQLMVLVSDASIGSDWVRRELDAHLERPRERWNIAPVFLDPRYPENLPNELKIIGQFRGVPLPMQSGAPAVTAKSSRALRSELSSRFSATRSRTLIQRTAAVILLPLLGLAGWSMYLTTDHADVMSAWRRGEALFAASPSPAWIPAMAAQGELDRAVAELNKPQYGVRPDSLVPTYLYVARELFDDGRAVEASQLLEQATELAKSSQYGDATLLVSVGDTYNAVGRRDRALALFSEAEQAVADSGPHVQDRLWTELAGAFAEIGQPARAESLVRRNPNRLEGATALAKIAAAYAKANRIPDADRLLRTLDHCDRIAAVSETALASTPQQFPSERMNEITDTISADPGMASCPGAVLAAAALAKYGRDTEADRLLEQIEREGTRLNTVDGLVTLARDYDRAGLVDRRDAALDDAFRLAQQAWITNDREWQLIKVGTAFAEAGRYEHALRAADLLGPSAMDVYAAIIRAYQDRHGR